MEQPNVVTFKKVQTGIFDVYVNGEKVKYQIINGSLGMSGRDTVNTYGITKPDGSVTWIGPLNSCKKGLVYSLGKKKALPVSPVPKLVW